MLVPFGVDKLEDQTFSGCTSLEFVRVGHRKKPTAIGSLAFYGCSSLKGVLFTSTITSLGSLCFAFCTSLEAIAIPENVTDIDNSSFNNTNLKAIYVAPKEIYASKFDTWHFKGKLPVKLLKPFVSNIVGNYSLVAKTICLRNKVLIDKAPAPFVAYSVESIQDGKVILSEVSNGVLEAGKAYVVGGNNAYFYNNHAAPMYGITFSLEDDEGPLVENALLQGVYEDTYAPVGSYVLQPDGKFHLVTQANTVKVGANHAYLSIPGADNAPMLSIQYGGETTGIGGITETKKEADTNLYDLMGRRVTTPQKGQIYIRGGKKVIY